MMWNTIPGALWHALVMSLSMGWEILWPLVLGFTISAIVQAVVSKSEMSRLLPDASPRTLGTASLLGAASSSCSYAAVALARSLVRKGANFTAAMAFQVASTNLVVELGIILAVFMGWQFTLAEFVGGALMVCSMAVLFRFLLRPQWEREARQQADRGVAGRMEGHAEMDMAVAEGPLLQRIFSAKGWTAISHYFVMDWASILPDLLLGLLIAGALAAWVPNDFWSAFFLQGNPTLAKIWGPIVGPLVAILSFVCSVGNVPLAAVLWKGGISFGGVVAFLFADLIVLPILNIYRKYYGLRMAALILGVFYVSMVAVALVVELLFGVAGLIPQERKAEVVEATIQWNYTTVLNIIFLIVAALLLFRFFKTGGPQMLRRMSTRNDSTSPASPGWRLPAKGRQPA